MEFNTVILGSSSFSLADYVVIGISLGVVLICGIYHASFTGKSPEDFLLGGRSMGTFPIAVSTAMLYVSALTIIDSPAEIYYNGAESFMASIIIAAIVPISAFLFVPMMHRMELTSVYQYIGHRFDSTFLRCMTSFTFIVQHLFLTTVMMILVSTVLEQHFGIPKLTSVALIGIFAAINTTLGGFKGAVWTQIFHFCMITAFLTILAVVGGSRAGGFMNAFELAGKNRRLELFNFKVDPFMRHNFFNFVFGYGFIILMEMATCQPLVQRYSSVPTRADAMKSIFMGIPLHIVPSFLCLLTGVFLQAAFAGCDPLAFQEITRPQDLVPYFVHKNMAFVPGITGFFVACIVGGGVSLCCTSVNAMVACTFKDFVSKLNCCKPSELKFGGPEISSKPSESELRGQATSCKTISFVYVALCTAVAVVAVKFPDLDKSHIFSNGSSIITFNAVLYGPLAGVFLMAMFFPCINKYGASIGFGVGVTCVGFLAVNALFLSDSTTVAPLPRIVGNCPDAEGINSTFLRFIPWHPKDVNPPTGRVEPWNFDIHDFHSLSYLLYTLFGAILTMVISFPISVLTCGLCVCAARKVPATLLHPTLSFSDCCIDSEKRELRHAISHRYVDRIASVHNLYPGSGTRLDSKPPSYKYSSIPSSSPTSLP